MISLLLKDNLLIDLQILAELINITEYLNY